MEAADNKDIDTTTDNLEEPDNPMEGTDNENAEDESKGFAKEEVDNSEEETAGEEDSEEETAAEENSEDAQSGKKGLFKKKDKKSKQEEKIAELSDRVQRQMAEFDNFRKRSEKEKTMMFETGARSVIEKILPVVDNFERGLASVPDEEKENGFAQGMEMIYKQLMTELEKMEVKPIPAVGEEFNPDFHNAVMQVESEEYESGVIAQELQKGYTYRDSVVRHSMVAVVS